jgi:GNAT superfamily N-acetyltransferase
MQFACNLRITAESPPNHRRIPTTTASSEMPAGISTKVLSLLPDWGRMELASDRCVLVGTTIETKRRIIKMEWNATAAVLSAGIRLIGIDLLEWIGYLASVLVLVSLLMSSIVRLRWINLAGSIIFSLYGFLIGALPVGFMNLGIVLINAYYLVKIYGTREYFHIMPIGKDSAYLTHFLAFYRDEIQRFFAQNDYRTGGDVIGFFILRNMVPAGIFLAHPTAPDTLEVDLDFVIPEYRDFKIGHFLFVEQKRYFLDQGYSTLTTCALNEKHGRYLERMGFHLDREASDSTVVRYILTLQR